MEDEITDFTFTIFPVGTLVTPKKHRHIRSQDYTPGTVYEVIDVDDRWNYIIDNNGFRMGIAGWALKEVPPLHHPMQGAEEYDEIIAAQTLMER